MTIHKWSGLNDGRFDSARLIELISTNERLALLRKRILEVDVLIIDEISVSKSLFDKLESVLRAIRASTKIFGGIQIIEVGDFMQLPPVKNPRYKDFGDFAFESENFFKHKFF